MRVSSAYYLLAPTMPEIGKALGLSFQPALSHRTPSLLRVGIQRSGTENLVERIGEQRECLDTSIEIIARSLDVGNNLKDLTFKWWTGARLDHMYRYAPYKGMVNAWPQ